MKSLSPAFQAHLDSGATTLCWCWRVTRRTGEKLGFTDHDRDLVFDGTTFEAATGFTASDIRSSIGLSVDDLEVESALISSRLSEAALSAGDFDAATVENFRVNWNDPAQRVLMRQGALGERNERALEDFVLRAPGRIGHAVALLEVPAGAKSPSARAGEYDAAQVFRLRGDARPQVGLVASHLRIERIQDFGPVEPHQQDLLTLGLQFQCLIFLRIQFRSKPASRRYFCTPGWISSARGAAAPMFAAVLSFACSRRAAIGPSARCSARARR